jgi:hypothetical protein
LLQKLLEADVKVDQPYAVKLTVNGEEKQCVIKIDGGGQIYFAGTTIGTDKYAYHCSGEPSNIFPGLEWMVLGDSIKEQAFDRLKNSEARNLITVIAAPAITSDRLSPELLKAFELQENQPFVARGDKVFRINDGLIEVAVDKEQTLISVLADQNVIEGKNIEWRACGFNLSEHYNSLSGMLQDWYRTRRKITVTELEHVGPEGFTPSSVEVSYTPPRSEPGNSEKPPNSVPAGEGAGDTGTGNEASEGSETEEVEEGQIRGGTTVTAVSVAAVSVANGLWNMFGEDHSFLQRVVGVAEVALGGLAACLGFSKPLQDGLYDLLQPAEEPKKEGEANLIESIKEFARNVLFHHDQARS